MGAHSIQHSIILMVGAVIVVLMHNIPYKWFQVFPVFLLPGFRNTADIGHDDGTYQRGGALDDVHGHTVPTLGDSQNGGYHSHCAFILSKGQDEDGANPKAFKRIMIITGVICLLIAPENLSTAALLFGVVFLMMFIGRVSAKRLLMLIGSLASVGIVAVTFLLMTKNSDTLVLHRVRHVACPYREVYE